MSARLRNGVLKEVSEQTADNSCTSVHELSARLRRGVLKEVSEQTGIHERVIRGDLELVREFGKEETRRNCRLN